MENQKSYFSGIKESSICLDCRKSSGLCSWSRNFVPVEGWDAELTGDKRDGPSYLVKSCPLYEDDTKGRAVLRYKRNTKGFFEHMVGRKR